MDGLAEDESCRFRPPKSVQEEGSLLVQSKQEHSIKTSGPLRFSELGKQRGSKNSVYLTWQACSKIMMFTVWFLVWNCLWLKAVFGGRKWRECIEFFRQQ